MPAAAFVGLSTVDIVYPVPAPPAAGRKLQAAAQWLAAGGPAANAAVTYAVLSTAAGRPAPVGIGAYDAIRGGAAAVLVTVLGGHPLAEFARDELASRGVVVVDAVPERGEPPAVSSAWLTADGERTVVSANAAGVAAVPPRGLAEVVGVAGVVLLDGHHPELALASARAATGRVVLDGGSWKPVLPELLPLVRTAICSADFRPPCGAPVADVLRGHGVAEVAVTAGPEPVRWWRGTESGTVPVPAADAVDTLGAGDAFHGAYAWAVATRPDAPFPAALGFAATIAAIRCETPGPRAWLTDRRLGEHAAAWQRAG
jgi:sugar/nucleoside kinase (ribokinase family)